MSRKKRKPSKKKSAREGFSWGWAGWYLGRVLQVTGLLVTLVAATAFFGTPSTLAMLRMMLIGVLFFVPGWWLTRADPTR